MFGPKIENSCSFNFKIFVRNVYFEKSKADDVQFILDLIKKIEEEIPQADMTNVNIAGQHQLYMDD